MRWFLVILVGITFLLAPTLVIGIALPLLGVIGTPGAAIYVLPRSTTLEKLLVGAASLVWVFFVSLILKNGYITEEQYMSGPTVSPMLWLPVVLLSYAAVASKRNRKSASGSASAAIENDA